MMDETGLFLGFGIGYGSRTTVVFIDNFQLIFTPAEVSNRI